MKRYKKLVVNSCIILFVRINIIIIVYTNYPNRMRTVWLLIMVSCRYYHVWLKSLGTTVASLEDLFLFPSLWIVGRNAMETGANEPTRKTTQLYKGERSTVQTNNSADCSIDISEYLIALLALGEIGSSSSISSVLASKHSRCLQ